MMKAIRILKQKTKPLLTTVEIPSAGPGQILVKMEYSPINPHDIGSIMGFQKQSQMFPLTLGVEGIGKVESVGNGVSSNLIGKRVSCIASSGTWAEYCTATYWNQIPENLDPQIGSCISLAPLTSICLLKELEGYNSFFLSAPTSTIGKQTIALALKNGKTPICITSEEDNGDIQSSITVDNSDEDRIEELSKEHNVLRGIDLVGGGMTEIMLNSLQRYGRIISVGNLSMEPVDFDPKQLIFKRKEIYGFNLYHYLPQHDKEGLGRLISENIEMFKPKISNVFNLGNYIQALKYYFSNFHDGKVLIKVE